MAIQHPAERTQEDMDAWTHLAMRLVRRSNGGGAIALGSLLKSASIEANANAALLDRLYTMRGRAVVASVAINNAHLFRETDDTTCVY